MLIYFINLMQFIVLVINIHSFIYLVEKSGIERICDRSLINFTENIESLLHIYYSHAYIFYLYR